MMMTDRSDAASDLLAEYTPVREGDIVVHLGCRSGAFGIAAARSGNASRVILCDRNLAAVNAVRDALAGTTRVQAEVFAGHGSASLPSDIRGSANIVGFRIPREKIALQQLLLDAFDLLRVGGTCCIAGGNDDGIKSAARLLGELFGNSDVVVRSGGNRLVSAMKRADDPADLSSFASPLLGHDSFNEIPVTLRGVSFTLFTRPGVFSWEHIDEATRILCDVITLRTNDTVLDIGCGAGALGVVAATLSGTGAVCMVDVDTEAVRCATLTAARAGVANVRVLGSDVASAVISEKFDVVVTNPPFHAGKATDLNLPARFIDDAHHVLKTGGRLFLVANRTLPYERMIAARFGSAGVIHDGPRFKVLTATR